MIVPEVILVAYSIHYSPQETKKYPIRAGKGISFKKKLPVIIAVCCICAMLHTTVRQGIKNLLLPADALVTQTAFSQFVADLRNGDDIGSAFTAFCQYVIVNANA